MEAPQVCENTQGGDFLINLCLQASWRAGGNTEASSEPQGSHRGHCHRWQGNNLLCQTAGKFQGMVQKSSLDNTTTAKMTGLVKGITNQVCTQLSISIYARLHLNVILTNPFHLQARSVVRDLDPVNELAFLRLRSNKTEFLIAPGGQKIASKLTVPSFRQGLHSCGPSDAAF